MWIFTNTSFLSIVGNETSPEKEELLVRGRIKGDIEHLFPESQIDMHEDRDYRYRTWVPRNRVGEVLGKCSEQIDYSNFKNSISKNDLERGRAYMEVWQSMFRYMNRQHSRDGVISDESI